MNLFVCFKGDVSNVLRRLIVEVPDWVSSLTIRNVEYLKIKRAAPFAPILEKLNEMVNDKRKSLSWFVKYSKMEYCLIVLWILIFKFVWNLFHGFESLEFSLQSSVLLPECCSKQQPGILKSKLGLHTLDWYLFSTYIYIFILYQDTIVKWYIVLCFTLIELFLREHPKEAPGLIIYRENNKLIFY